MISIIQTALRYLFDATLNPDGWSIEEPTGLKGTGQVSQLGSWSRLMCQVPILSTQLKKEGEPGIVSGKHILQYRCMFRFPGNLKYDQLPMRKLTDILSYLIFLFQTHPTLLTSTPTEIASTLNWTYPHVDKCLYPTAPNKLQVSGLEVNGFIPVCELEGSDWVVVLVWSLTLMTRASISEYRKFWLTNLDPNQITANPNLTGGLIPVLPYSIGLAVDTINEVASHNPSPGTLTN